ncbi:MAG: hypothetical protein IJU03_03150 [Thermoguttaceae bacterium]|nr:hypothetical protein [Thermoguttaceae bacterium]
MQRILSYASLLFAILFSFTNPKVQNSFESAFGLEGNLNYYESQFKSILQAPSSDDSSWQRVSNEKLKETLQFLVDQQNSNYDRIRTWSGTYEQVQSARIPQPLAEIKPIVEQNNGSIPSSSVREDVYRFFRDFKADKTFFAFDCKNELFCNDSGTVLEGETNIGQGSLEGIITSKENITFWRDLNYGYPSAIATPSSPSVKMCQIEPANSLPLSDVSSYLDPRAFFCPIVEPQSKRWREIEDIVLPHLKEGSGKTEVGTPVELYEKESDGIVWFWLNIGGSAILNEYAFSSDSGYNIIHHAVIDDGKIVNSINLEYAKVNEVYVPSAMLLQYTTRSAQTDEVSKPNNFRYLKLVDAKINESIPSKQFTLDALDLDEDVLIQNTIDETYYHYIDGKLVPFVKFGSSELIIPKTPVWRSPVRMIALGLGVLLIIVAVIFKTRRKQVETT